MHCQVSFSMYRLRDMIDGRQTYVELGGGHLGTGSSRTADVYLPGFAVSRQQASGSCVAEVKRLQIEGPLP